MASVTMPEFTLDSWTNGETLSASKMNYILTYTNNLVSRLNDILDSLYAQTISTDARLSEVTVDISRTEAQLDQEIQRLETRIRALESSTT